MVLPVAELSLYGDDHINPVRVTRLLHCGLMPKSLGDLIIAPDDITCPVSQCPWVCTWAVYEGRDGQFSAAYVAEVRFCVVEHESGAHQDLSVSFAWSSWLQSSGRGFNSDYDLSLCNSTACPTEEAAEASTGRSTLFSLPQTNEAQIMFIVTLQAVLCYGKIFGRSPGYVLG